MVQIFDTTPTPSRIGESLGMGINKYMENQQQQEQQGQLANLLFGEEEGQKYAGIPAEQLLQYSKIQGQAKADQQKQQYQQQEQQRKVQQQEQKDAKNLSPFKKKMQEKIANYLIDSVENREKVVGAKNDIKILRGLASKLQGPKGYGKALVGSEEAAQFTAIGMTSLAPILGILAQGGRLSDYKVKLIMDTHAVSPWDNRWTMEGKIKSLESLVEKTEAYQDKIGRLYEKYGEDIPIQEILKLDSEAVKIADEAISSKKITEKSTEKEKGLPSAKNNKGKVIVNSETGEELISDGKNWITQ